MVKMWNDYCRKYPILSIEDGMAEDDFEGWEVMTDKLGDKIKLVGDNLFVTDKLRLKKGLDLKIANSIIIKPNQIGTLTETLGTIELAKTNGYTPIISCRSGETGGVPPAVAGNGEQKFCIFFPGRRVGGLLKRSRRRTTPDLPLLFSLPARPADLPSKDTAARTLGFPSNGPHWTHGSSRVQGYGAASGSH